MAKSAVVTGITGQDDSYLSELRERILFNRESPRRGETQLAEHERMVYDKDYVTGPGRPLAPWK